MRFCLALSVFVLAVFQILAGQTQASGTGKPANGDCGLVYGKGHAFWVCAPKGWLLDNSILSKDGIYAVFYPEGSSLANAKESGTFMYVNTSKKANPNEDITTLMRNDATDTKAKVPKAEIHEAEAIKVKDIVARVQQFTPGAFDRFEAVAYIDSPEVIVMIVMTSKNAQAFDRDYHVFKELVGSYSFMTSNVTLPKK